MKTNVPGLVKTERNAVVKRMTIATSVARVKPRLLLVDLVERHDLKDLRWLKVVVDAYYRYFVVLIRLGVYLRGRRVNDSVGDFEGRHRLADDTTVLGRREVYKKLSISVRLIRAARCWAESRVISETQKMQLSLRR